MAPVTRVLLRPARMISGYTQQVTARCSFSGFCHRSPGCAEAAVRTSAFSPAQGALHPAGSPRVKSVPETASDLVINMATVTFRVVPKKNRTYHVELVRPDGSRRTITGFRSEHEAQAWGIQAERMISAERPRLDMRFAGRQTNRPSGEH